MALEVAFLVLALKAGLFQKLFCSRCRINFFKQGVVLGERYFKYQIVHDRQTLVERGQKRNSKRKGYIARALRARRTKFQGDQLCL